MKKNRAVFRCAALVVAAAAWAVPGFADCSSPDGRISALNFDYSQDRWYYCDSTDIWKPLGGSGGSGFADRIVSGTSSIIVSNSGHISFTTTGSERMVINSAGNVGIGTSAPTSELEVSGTLHITRGSSKMQLATQGYDSFFSWYGGPLIFFGNSAERMRILSNGNLGIGTSSPGYALDVSGSIRAGTGSGDKGSVILSEGSGGNTGYVNFSNPAGTRVGYLGYGFIGGTPLTLHTDGDTGLAFSTNATERMRILSNGNAGIGTDTPNAKLTVMQAAPGYSPSITYASAAAAIFNNASQEIAFGTDVSSPYASWFQVRRNDNTAQTLALNPLGGNVGIGTKTPKDTLSVFGNAPALRLGTVGAADWDQSLISLITQEDQTKFLGESGLKGWSIYGRGNAFISPEQVNDFGLAFWDGTTWRLSLAADSLTGSVGIGTSEPSAKLSVGSGASLASLSAMSTNFLTYSGNLGTTANDELLLASHAFGNVGGNQAALGIRALRTADGNLWNTSAIGLGMDVDNTLLAGASMWLHSNGNVGISITNPNAKLDVAGIISSTGLAVTGIVTATTRVATAEICDENGANCADVSAGLGGGGGGGSPVDSISSTGTAARVFTTAGGTISFTTGSVAQTAYLDTLGRYVGPGVSVTTMHGISSTNGYFTGNVGIGTNVPAAKLDVFGGSLRVVDGASNPIVLILGTNAGSFPPAFIFQGQRTGQAHLQAGDWLGYADWRNRSFDASARLIATASENHSGTAAGADVVLMTTPNGTLSLAERLRVTNSGNVGIGTTNPSTKLDVAGIISATGVTVTGDISYTGILADTSDRRAKHDIRALPASLEDILKLQAVSFRMNNHPQRVEYGFIAQDVEKVFPLLVNTASDPSATKSLNYMGFIAPMVKGMQELRAENLALRAANDNQAKVIDTLTRRLDALESKIVW